MDAVGRSGHWRGWPWALVLLVSPLAARAGDIVPSPQQATVLTVPGGLPSYNIQFTLDSGRGIVRASETVRFTNRSNALIANAIFHVYPRYKVPDSDRMLLTKTVEMLRLSPEEGVDAEGDRLSVQSAWVGDRSRRAAYRFAPTDPTILEVDLPHALGPGQSIELGVDFELVLPSKWGRWCRYRDVTSLVNWYPILAHHDDRGWERTPFVPWHQPWHQEAATYRVTAVLPSGEEVASTGVVTSVAPLENGLKQVVIEAGPSRDFALVCSSRFRVWTREVGSIRVRVLGFPEHEPNALRILEYAGEVLPLYQDWFGPYAGREMDYVAAFFGWNGNECSELVMLDDRVMRLPTAGQRYLDHLVTHETCHQWWWNVVGTDGYAETFMDEGLVNSFTAMRLDAKYGRGAPLITWPDGWKWLPTIGREDLRLSGYHTWRAKGGKGPVIQDLKAMSNLENLFTLAYDRGGKVIDMIRNRLGEKRFFAFFRAVYSRYAYQTIHYADLKNELNLFDPAGDWPAFLDRWLIEDTTTDWAMGHVEFEPRLADGRIPLTITLRQLGGSPEPTIVQCETETSTLRIPVWPERGSYTLPSGRVEHQPGADSWIVHLLAPEPPQQIEIDPDHTLLDEHPDNNRWRSKIAWRFTPAITPLDESARFQAYDRVSVVAGPFVDSYARGGLKFGIQRINRWSVIGFAGFEPSLNQPIFGGQATLFHFPKPMWAAGLFYEEGLYNWYGDRRHSGGRVFLRRRLIESVSVLLDDPGFVELYYGMGNEFWPGDDARPINAQMNAIGLRARLNTQFPYWDPVDGNLLEGSVEQGVQLFGSDQDYTRMTGEFGLVRPIPSTWPVPSSSKIAFRAFGGVTFPDDVSTLRLGGGRRHRALNLTDLEGSALWLMTLEGRFPLWLGINHDVLDHTLSANQLGFVVFYDVGQTYWRGDWSDVVHGVGLGLRLDVTLFSFLERANLRLDVSKAVGLDLPPIFWFGLNQVF